MAFQDFIEGLPDPNTNARLLAFSDEMTALTQKESNLLFDSFATAWIRALEAVLKEVVMSCPEARHRMERITADAISPPPDTLGNALTGVFVDGVLSRLRT